MKRIIGTSTRALVAGMIAATASGLAHAGPAQDQAGQTAAGTSTAQEQQGVTGFAFDAAKVPPKAMPTLDELAAAANNNPDSKVVIVGHTDNVGDPKYNQSLALDRAQLVRSALVRRGVDIKRITVESGGEDNPVASNDTRDGRRENRRAEVMIGDMESRMVGSSQGGTTASSSDEGEQSAHSGQSSQNGQSSQSSQDERSGQSQQSGQSSEHKE
jgi:outer membrane protein OmpA-like peptidoglycan-associated protein